MHFYELLNSKPSLFTTLKLIQCFRKLYAQFENYLQNLHVLDLKNVRIIWMIMTFFIRHFLEVPQFVTFYCLLVVDFVYF
jgi:hypothetical protein